MNYITISDILNKVQPHDLADILDVSDNDITTGFTHEILDYAEKVATDMAYAYISGRFDMPVEFSKTGMTRDFFIVNNCVNILIKTIYERVSAKSIPIHITESYTATIEAFKDIQNQKFTPHIEERTDEGKVRRIYSSSNQKITYHY